VKRSRRFDNVLAIPLLVASLVLVLGGIGVVRAQLRIAQDEIAKDLAAVATLKVAQIEAWRTDLLRDADMKLFPFLHRDLVMYLSDGDVNARERILERFRGLAGLHELWNVQVVDADGAIRVSLRDDDHDCHDYREALDTAFASGAPFMLDLHTDERQASVLPHVSTVTPVYPEISPEHPEASPRLGALVLIADAGNFLFPLLSSWPAESPTAETILVRRDGSDVLFLTELRHTDAAPLTLRVPIDTSAGAFVGSMAVRGTTGFVRGTDYRGRPVVASVRPVADSSWVMVSKMDTREAFADARRQVTLLILLVVGLVGAVILAGLVIQQRQRKAHYRDLFRSESRLREAMERHSVTLRSIGDAVIAVDMGRRVEVLNPAAEMLTGWSQTEAVGRPVNEVFHILDGKTRTLREDPIAGVLETGQTLELTDNTLLVARNGAEFQIADSAAPIRNEEGSITGAVLVFRDVTEEQRIQQALKTSETLYRDLIESTDAITWEYNLAFDEWTYVAPQVTKVLGWAPNEWTGLEFWKENLHPDDRETAFTSCMTLTGRGENHELEYRFQRKDGNYVWIRDVISVEMETDTPIKIRGVMIDITERKQAEQKLQAAFDEKAQLLRELYHRTKNNMQVIISLLNLHGSASSSAEVKDVLRDNAQRIQSMALVHEMLYRSQSLSRVDLGDYLQELVSLLVSTYDSGGGRITTRLQLDSMWVSIDIAIPCGMVANELVTNAMKHAFATDESGFIGVSLTRRGDEDGAILEISDNGRGLPPGFDWRESTTIGMQTAVSIVEHQLQGTINFVSGSENREDAGTSCTIEFAYDDKPVRV
jgi:PAS domain S-box-containing protein